MMSKFWEESEGSDEMSSDDDESDASGSEDDDELGVASQKHAIESELSAADRLSCQVDETWRNVQTSQRYEDPIQRVTRTMPSSAVASRQPFDGGCTRLVCMSDTHGQHRDVFLPAGDVLIHGGDVTKSGEVGTIDDLSRYFGESSFREIICIAGNHDITLDPAYYQRAWQRFHREPFDTATARASLKNCTYLEDESCHVAQGKVRIYGSPWTPEFYDWAFNHPRGKLLRDIWSRIPSDTDVLITHGPPLGRCDLVAHGVRTGCYDLLQEVQQRVKPRVHVFGHIHEGYGVSYDGQTLFVNASNLNIRYQAVNPCVVIDLPHDKCQPAVLVVPNCTLTGPEFIVWCKGKGYSQLATMLDALAIQELPSGNNLLQTETFQVLIDKLQLHRNGEVRLELRRAVSQLLAESY